MSSKLYSNLSHTEVEDLIPTYINGKLSSDLQRNVQEHIAHCERCFQAQQEADLVRKLLSPGAGNLQPLLTEQNVSATINRSIANIDSAEPGESPKRYSLLQKSPLQNNFLQNHIATWWKALQETNTPVRLTLLAQAILLSVMAGLLFSPTISPQQDLRFYQTQSHSNVQPFQATPGSVPGQYSFYRIVFKPAAQETVIRQLLIDVEAQLYNGPSEMGVYTIVITSSQHPANDKLKQIRMNPSVLLVEQVVERTTYRNH